VIASDHAASCASERLAADLRDFMTNVDAECRRLYRDHLQTTVRRVSPLVIDLAVFGGSRLVDLAWEFEPPLGWPWEASDTGMLGSAPSIVQCSIARPHRRTRAPGRPGTDRRRGGMVVCTAPGCLGEIGFMVTGSHVEVVAALGGVILHTNAGRASLLIPEGLPQSIAASLPGRRLEFLLRHEVLDGRGYVIESVNDARQGGGSAIGFNTGLLPFEMPWAQPEGSQG